MTVDAAKYRPPTISQRDTLLAADGIDDCRAVAALYLAACATSGELLIWPNGTPMGRRSRVALVKKARRSLGPAKASGGLNTTDTTAMLKWLVPAAPTLYPSDLNFGGLRSYLRNGYSASLSGNPGDIKGSSPLKRAGNVGHEFFLHSERANGDILVGDPFKPHSPRFGEWRPAKEVRQFAYRDSDNTLTAVFVLERGTWEHAALTRSAMHEILSKRTDRILGLIDKVDERDNLIAEMEKRLADSEPGIRNAKAAGFESALVRGIEALQELRTSGQKEQTHEADDARLPER